jgi:hypothetical protein
MTDILQDMAGFLAKIDDGELEEIFDEDPMVIYTMLSRAVGEIERLRKVNIDMGWRLNPDRMGGQFTQEELNRGNEWNG